MPKKSLKSSDSKPSFKDLEREKLELELKQLRKPWYLKPGYLGGVILPFVLAGFALLKVWSTGYFDIERKTLKVELRQIQDSVSLLRAEKQNLLAEFDEFLFWKNALKIKVEVLNPDRLKFAKDDWGELTGELRYIGDVLSDMEQFEDSLLHKTWEETLLLVYETWSKLNRKELLPGNEDWETTVDEIEEAFAIFSFRIERGAAGMELLTDTERFIQLINSIDLKPDNSPIVSVVKDSIQ